MSLTILEATVEIVKASFNNSGGASTMGSSAYYIADEDVRKNFLKGVEELYNKLNELEKKRS